MRLREVVEYATDSIHRSVGDTAHQFAAEPAHSLLATGLAIGGSKPEAIADGDHGR